MKPTEKVDTVPRGVINWPEHGCRLSVCLQSSICFIWIFFKLADEGDMDMFKVTSSRLMNVVDTERHLLTFQHSEH